MSLQIARANANSVEHMLLFVPSDTQDIDCFTLYNSCYEILDVPIPLKAICT